jgi:hypothetical protein
MMTVFWGITLCILIEIYRSLKGAYCLHHQGDLSTWRWMQWTSLKHRSISTILHYATYQKQSSSQSLPWEPEISRIMYKDMIHNDCVSMLRHWPPPLQWNTLHTGTGNTVSGKQAPGLRAPNCSVNTRHLYWWLQQRPWKCHDILLWMLRK